MKLLLHKPTSAAKYCKCVESTAVDNIMVGIKKEEFATRSFSVAKVNFFLTKSVCSASISFSLEPHQVHVEKAEARMRGICFKEARVFKKLKAELFYLLNLCSSLPALKQPQ